MPKRRQEQIEDQVDELLTRNVVVTAALELQLADVHTPAGKWLCSISWRWPRMAGTLTRSQVSW